MTFYIFVFFDDVIILSECYDYVRIIICIIISFFVKLN